MNKFETLAKQCPCIQQFNCNSIDEQYVGLISAIWAFEYTQEWYPLETLKEIGKTVLVKYFDTEVTAYLEEYSKKIITSFGELELDRRCIKGWRPVSFP